MDIINLIREGKAVLGMELGSTRIKAVLIGPDHAPIASGDHTWENRLENGVWTYHLADVWTGVQDAFANLKKDVAEKYGVKLTGATVHFVDSGMDTGPIIAQKAVEVLPGDTPEVLQRRVMEQAEWLLLPQAIDMIANNRI